MHLIPLLISCTGAGDGPLDTGPTPPTATMEHAFSFAVIADPHIAGPVDHEDRLARAVDWINTEASDRDIQFALVLGDIGWGGHVDRSRELLDAFQIPWVPINGDNEVNVGEDQVYAEAFAPQYETLAGQLDDWRKAEMPVWDPVHEVDAWFQNLAFEHGGVLFVATDWCIRGVTGMAGEFGDLHDFEGGTWPWLMDALANVESRPKESVVLLSHIPLMAGALDIDEVGIVDAELFQIGDWIHGAHAGHLHVTYDVVNKAGGYNVFVTDATWDDEITVRVVDVSTDGESFSFYQDLITVKLTG